MQSFKNDESVPKIINAHYIGSDYTYAYSQKFRDCIFRDNTLDESLLIGVSARPIPEGPEEAEAEPGLDPPAPLVPAILGPQELLQQRMREDIQFNHWLSNVTQEEGVHNISQARVLLHHIERR